jgi:predicted NBD/HSP70 family sugar kinase
MAVKYINETRVLQLLYWEGELTQMEIKKHLKLSSPTITQAIQMFRKAGLLIDGTELKSSGGRKPRKIAFNYNACHSVGLEIRRHSVVIVITNLKGIVISSEIKRLDFENTSSYWCALNGYVKELIEKTAGVQMVLGVGIAFPGEVSFGDSMIERAVVLGLRKVPLDNIRRHFDYDIYIENGASTAGFGAAWRDKVIKNAAYIVVTDDGVAGAIILDNHIFRGGGKAGAFGHMTLNPAGKICFCGARGCWTAYCALSNLSNVCDGDLDLFFQRLEQKDDICMQKWDEYLNYFAQALDNLALSLDLDIIIGGKIIRYLPPYMDDLRQKMQKVPSLFENMPLVRMDDVDENSLAIGASLIFVDRLLSGRIDFKQKFKEIADE